MNIKGFAVCLLVLSLLPLSPAKAANTNDPEYQFSANTEGNLVTISATSVGGVVGSDGSVGGVVGGGWYGSPVVVSPSSAGVVRVNVRRKRDPFEWCEEKYRGNQWADLCQGDLHGRARLSSSGDGEGSDEVPPIVVLHAAMASASIAGAGLVVEPTGWVFTGVPTLAHAQHQVVSTSVEVLGFVVPVVFEAQEYVFDFHTGQPPVRTTSPGAPYPDMSIQGTYERPVQQSWVTLKTTWRATATHPVTGESLVVAGALRTEEHSAPFRVEKPRIRLISDAEFGRPQ